jgi:hypothetical protein
MIPSFFSGDKCANIIGRFCHGLRSDYAPLFRKGLYV